MAMGLLSVAVGLLSVAMGLSLAMGLFVTMDFHMFYAFAI